MSLAERLRNHPAVVGPPTAAAPAPAPATSPRAPAPEPAPPADGAVLSSSEISAQLSDLLLKGWRMLEEECPVTTACPLMLEKKTGRKFSVALQKYMDELGGEAEPEPEPAPAAVPAPAPQPQAAPKQAAAASDPPASEAAAPIDDDGDDAFFRQYREERIQELRQSTPPPPTAAAGAGDVGAVMERASAALVRQIAAAEGKLRGAVSVGEATQLAQLIGACAVALRQLDGGGGALLQ